jgi:4-carboxymuconolactone decarboxylase
VDEIKEILIHATSYCGTPAGRQCFLAVHAALENIDALPKTAP